MKFCITATSMRKPRLQKLLNLASNLPSRPSRSHILRYVINVWAMPSLGTLRMARYACCRSLLPQIHLIARPHFPLLTQNSALILPAPHPTSFNREFFSHSLWNGVSLLYDVIYAFNYSCGARSIATW